jgi:hypothetical protein
MANIKAEDLLAEVTDVIRTMPPRETMRHNTPENHAWLGRAVAVIGLWDMVQAPAARTYVDLIHQPMGALVSKGISGLVSLLHEAHATLRFRTIGPVNRAIDSGMVFDYFDELRKQIELAKRDVFFIDPYLDGDFVSTYLPCVAAGVSIRLLARERMSTLIPAAKLFAQQSGAEISVRSSSNFHDRYVLMDGALCFQSGASFKDGARKSPTTITQITDAFPAVQRTYEDLWAKAKPELSVLAADPGA